MKPGMSEDSRGLTRFVPALAMSGALWVIIILSLTYVFGGL